MASSGLGNGVGSSRSAKGAKTSSSSVDWLTRDLVEMRIRDKVVTDDERVKSCNLLICFEVSFSCLFSLTTLSLAYLYPRLAYSVRFSLCCQDSEPDIIDGAGTEPGHVIRTTVRGRDGHSRQVIRLLWKIVCNKMVTFSFSYSC